MSVVRLDEDDLDEEDLAILREVASKGYYHNRPKNSTNAPAPQRLTEDKAPVDPAAAAVPGLSAAGTAGRRSCFDAFQAKWDRFDNDAFLEELGEHSSLDANDATTRPGGAPTVVAKPPAQHLRRYAAEFKILLLGERGVGKTAFLLRHTTGEFAVAPPAGGAPLALRFMTNCGELCFQVWELRLESPESSFRQASAALVLCDGTRASGRALPRCLRLLKSHCGVVPIVLGLNKSDLGTVSDSVRKARQNCQRTQPLQCFEMSVKNQQNLEKPFWWLARRLCGQPHLAFAPPRAPLPPADGVAKGPSAEAVARQVARAVEVPVRES